MLPVYIGAGVSALIVVILLLSKLVKKKDKSTRDSEIVKDIKYSKAGQLLEEYSTEEVKETYNKNDILIPAKVEMKVGKKANILPGKYTILSTDNNRQTLNIKIGSYVRVYSHESEIILAEGDTIMPVAIGIILR